MSGSESDAKNQPAADEQLVSIGRALQFDPDKTQFLKLVDRNKLPEIPELKELRDSDGVFVLRSGTQHALVGLGRTNALQGLKVMSNDEWAGKLAPVADQIFKPIEVATGQGAEAADAGTLTDWLARSRESRASAREENLAAASELRRLADNS